MGPHGVIDGWPACGLIRHGGHSRAAIERGHFVKQIILMAAMAAASASLQARADEAYKWPLCEDIKPLLAAAEEPTPFLALNAQTPNGVIPGLASLGPDAGKTCRTYIAGTTEGIRGGGQWNFAECTVWYPTSGDKVSRAKLDEKRTYIAGILGTCEALDGWVFKLPDFETYATVEESWTNPETGVQVAVEREEYRGSRSSGGEVNFIIRAPNPSYTPPPDPQ